MSELRSVKRKKTKLLGKVSDAQGLTSRVTETETPEETITESEFATFDCGCAFQPDKTFIDGFTGKVVCRDCTVVCRACGRRLWIAKARRVPGTQDFYCPNHRLRAWMRILGRILFQGL